MSTIIFHQVVNSHTLAPPKCPRHSIILPYSLPLHCPTNPLLLVLKILSSKDNDVFNGCPLVYFLSSEVVHI